MEIETDENTLFAQIVDKNVGKQLEQRAEKLAGILVDVFGQDNATLLCHMVLSTMAIKRLDKCNTNEAEEG